MEFMTFDANDYEDAIFWSSHKSGKNNYLLDKSGIVWEYWDEQTPNLESMLSRVNFFGMNPHSKLIFVNTYGDIGTIDDSLSSDSVEFMFVSPDSPYADDFLEGKSYINLDESKRLNEDINSDELVNMANDIYDILSQEYSDKDIIIDCVNNNWMYEYIISYELNDKYNYDSNNLSESDIKFINRTVAEIALDQIL